MLDIVQVDVHPKKYIRALHVNVYWKVVRTGKYQQTYLSRDQWIKKHNSTVFCFTEIFSEELRDSMKISKISAYVLLHTVFI